MRELVVISGKGGTGKTSIVAAFAVLADKCVVADVDVDAADLHLVLAPTVISREAFSGGSRARIMLRECGACGVCVQICRFDAIRRDALGNGRMKGTYHVDPIACEGCGVCAHFCPDHAIEFLPVVNGELFVSETRCGPMVHARLGVAEANSGKLVSLVRRRAHALADERNMDWVIVDGSPGIGCPVIASITGADLVLVITEPTLSGLHDLRRVVDLTRHFGIETRICINKWDLNEKLTEEIEAYAGERGLLVAGRIRYDAAVTRAQVQARTIMEYECGAAEDVRALWEHMRGNPFIASAGNEPTREL